MIAQRYDLGPASLPHAAPLENATPHEVNADHGSSKALRSLEAACDHTMQRSSLRTSQTCKSLSGPRAAQGLSPMPINLTL
jgi:hypothetical protein